MRPATTCGPASTSGAGQPPARPQPPRRRGPRGSPSQQQNLPPSLPSAAGPARSPPPPPRSPPSPLPPGGGSVADRVAAARAGVARGQAAPSRRRGAYGSAVARAGGDGAGGSADTTPPPTPPPRAAHSVEGCATEFVAETLLPTRQGKFRLRGYRHTADGGLTHTEPCAIMTGKPEGGTSIPLRVHDACFTSEVLGSLKCDCADQLRLALDFIAGPGGPGLVIYLQQEGRGIGLANKIAAYALQEGGLDTVDANRALGLPDDAREYSSVASILADLGIRSVRLMTNNPRKVELLRGLGVSVVGRIPCLVQAQEHSLGYLLAKAGRMSHLLGADEKKEGAGGGGSAAGAAAAASSIPSLSPLASVDEEVGEDGSYSYGAGEEGELDGSFCFWEHGGEPLAPSAGDGGAPVAEAPGTPPSRMERVSGKRLVSLPVVEEGGVA